MAAGVDVFDRHAAEYDGWYDRHAAVYLAEVETLRRLVPPGGTGVEVGAGTGRFALPLGAALGIEPSRPMARIARRRGLPIVQAVGERLPLADARVDYVLLVTVVCFVAGVPSLLREVARVLKPDGKVVVGLIDRDSPLGRLYESRRDQDPFYRHARFYTAGDILAMLEQTGFRATSAYQAMLDLPGLARGQAPGDGIAVLPGYGTGAFVGIGAGKMPS